MADQSPPRSFWIISGVALLWNVIGIVTYIGSVTVSDDALAAMSEAERALMTDIPAWATGAYAVGVFAGAAGCILLLLRKAVASPLLIASLAGVIIQMGHAFLMADVIAVRGGSSVFLPLTIIVVAAYLVWYARKAQQLGWIS